MMGLQGSPVSFLRQGCECEERRQAPGAYTLVASACSIFCPTTKANHMAQIQGREKQTSLLHGTVAKSHCKETGTRLEEFLATWSATSAVRSHHVLSTMLVTRLSSSDPETLRVTLAHGKQEDLRPSCTTHAGNDRGTGEDAEPRGGGAAGLTCPHEDVWRPRWTSTTSAELRWVGPHASGAVLAPWGRCREHESSERSHLKGSWGRL